MHNSLNDMRSLPGPAPHRPDGRWAFTFLRSSSQAARDASRQSSPSPDGGEGSETLNSLVRFDLALVRLISAYARTPLMRFSAVAVSRLGNGGIYVILPIFTFARLGRGGFGVIVVAACHAAALHAVYPTLKRRVGRRRPCEVDHDLPCLLAVLDEHSFPSGHVMTLAAALVPLAYVDPGSTAYGAALVATMGWARVASGHHYPSDVIAGALLALATGYPITVAWFGQP